MVDLPLCFVSVPLESRVKPDDDGKPFRVVTERCHHCSKHLQGSWNCP